MTDLNSAGLAVLSFRVHTEPDAGVLTAVNFQIPAGNTATPTTVVFTGTYNSSVAHSVHEVFPGLAGPDSGGDNDAPRGQLQNAPTAVSIAEAALQAANKITFDVSQVSLSRSPVIR